MTHPYPEAGHHAEAAAPDRFTRNARIAAGLLALAAWLGLSRFVMDQAAKHEGGLLGAIWNNSRYLTDLSNLLLAVVMTGVALRSALLSRLAVVGCAVAAIAAMGSGFLLAGGRVAVGSSPLEDILLHGVVPWAAVLFWLVFVQHGALRWRQVLVWMAWPVGYWTYAMTRGVLTGKYPYPAVNPKQLGVTAVAITIALMILINALWAGALLGLDKLLGRKRAVR